MAEAYRRTRDALGIGADAPLRPDEAGVFLKYLLLEGLESGEIRYWRVRRRTDACLSLRRRLEELLAGLEAAADPADGPGMDWNALLRSLTAVPLYRRRLVDLALEAVLSEPLAPEILLQSAATAWQALAAALPGTWNHAVIFASAAFFAHEFHPLAVDACVHDCGRHGSPRINLLAAHADWLTGDGGLTRVLYLDLASGRLVETDLEVPLRPDSIQFLCLGHAERELHAALARRFDCLQANPAPASALADDKAATLAAWSALGLDVPAYRTLVPGDTAAAFDFLGRFAEIVAKPNQATEGELVAFFRRGQAQAQARAELERHLQRCWRQGDALVQQRRDGLRFRDPASGQNHTLALRFNLAFDGKRYKLESGYAQLGRDQHHPAACGRGGRIVPLDQALSGLMSGGQPIRPDGMDWSGIRAQAERAAGVFGGLLLMGLDVLLDLDPHGHIVPVFLEANPRPAGLSHSRLLAGDPLGPAPVGVSLSFWNGLSPENCPLRFPL